MVWALQTGVRRAKRTELAPRGAGGRRLPGPLYMEQGLMQSPPLDFLPSWRKFLDGLKERGSQQAEGRLVQNQRQEDSHIGPNVPPQTPAP
jgi:hypothetical protein